MGFHQAAIHTKSLPIGTTSLMLTLLNSRNMVQEGSYITSKSMTSKPEELTSGI